MSYVSQSHTNRSAAIAGVIGIHAGLGALIVLGLNAHAVIPALAPNPTAVNVPLTPPPPPPPETKPEPQQKASSPPIYVPATPSPLPPKPNFVETTTTLFPVSDEVILKALPPIDDVGPSVTPGLTPVAAAPRNNPSRWVTDNDYKPRWVGEGLSGTASFQLEVNVNGRVESCSITRSTGHMVLDRATCSLIERRARFKPATDSFGAATRGSYSSSIRWDLPE